MIAISSTWRLYDIDEQTVVTILAVEMNHVLVEFRDKPCPYGGQHREWWPKAWFTMGNKIMREQR